MAFKMKYGKNSNMGFPFKDSPMKQDNEGNWFTKAAKGVGDWWDHNVSETIRTGKDPMERRQEARRFNALMDPRNKSEHAIKTQKEYYAKQKAKKEKSEKVRNVLKETISKAQKAKDNKVNQQGLLGGLDSHAQK